MADYQWTFDGYGNNLYPKAEDDLESRFWEFHRLNPHVYDTIVFLANDWKEKKGDAPCSIAMLYEVARYTMNLNTKGDELFKLNNNHKAYYVRLLIKNLPHLESMFRIRSQKKEFVLTTDERHLDELHRKVYQRSS